MSDPTGDSEPQRSNRRRARRHRVLWHGQLAIPDSGRELDGALTDICEHGARFLTFSTAGIDRLLRRGHRVMVYLKQQGWLTAAVAWTSDDAIGLQFAGATLDVGRLLDAESVSAGRMA